jgi:hypothetical protein
MASPSRQCVKRPPWEKVISGRYVLAGGETGPFRRRWEDRRPIPGEALAERGRPAYTRVGTGEPKRKFRVIVLGADFLAIGRK